MPTIEKLIRDNKNIALLNFNSIIEINKYLGIQTEILLSSEIEKDNSLTAAAKVIHINEILGADTYYNSIGGYELYNKDEFAQHGIKLFFLKMKGIEYPQFSNEFVPNLSIVDVLMFNDIEIVRGYLDEFRLV